MRATARIWRRFISRHHFAEINRRLPKELAVARMDCNLAYEDALKAHPEWFERNQDGSPRPHGESPWLFATCMFSAYFSEQMPAIYRENQSAIIPSTASSPMAGHQPGLCVSVTARVADAFSRS